MLLLERMVACVAAWRRWAHRVARLVVQQRPWMGIRVLALVRVAPGAGMPFAPGGEGLPAWGEAERVLRDGGGGRSCKAQKQPENPSLLRRKWLGVGEGEREGGKSQRGSEVN